MVLTLQFVLHRWLPGNCQDLLIAAAHLAVIRVHHQGCQRWVAAAVRFTHHPA
ncbi:hypothetical protein ACFQWA_14930 [Streptomyces thermogriseus]|uniref:hypothetical protein n=1 Tax=Streptomyces thermogriseus TaxID=75292 RepID=UPI0031F7BE37